MILVRYRRIIYFLLLSQITCTSNSMVNAPPVNSGQTNKNTNITVTKIEKIGDIPNKNPDCPYFLQFIDQSNGWLFCQGNFWRTSNGGNDWHVIYIHERASEHFLDFSFINSQVGWMFSESKILKTEDGGRTWTQINSPLDPEKGEISSVRFLKDGQRGWVSGGIYEKIEPGNPQNDGLRRIYQNSGKAPHGVIFYTENGGKSWQKQYILPYLGSLIHIFTPSEQGVWACDDLWIYHHKAGNWAKSNYKQGECEKRRLLETVGLDKSGRDLYEITEAFFSSTHGWLAFRNGYMAKTIDGGQTWCDLLDPKAIQEKPDEITSFMNLYFTDSENGWALSIRGDIYETNNGGSTWTKVSTNINFSNIYFLDSQHGWAVGKEGLFRINLKP